MSWTMWITGRPGSGETTPASHVAEAVQPWPVTLKVLDGADTGVAVIPDIALDSEESFDPDLRLHTHATDFRSTVDDVLLLAGRLPCAAAATVTQAERNVP